MRAYVIEIDSLEEGIKEIIGELSSDRQTLICKENGYVRQYGSKYWSVNRIDMIRKAGQIKNERIKHLQNEIDKLNSIKF